MSTPTSPNSELSVTENIRGNLDDDGCVLNEFPKPYKLSCTPFQEDDFDPKVRQACEMNKDFQTGVRIAKVIVVGDVAVGKTCLVNRFCHKRFDFEYKGTIGVDFEVKKFEVLKTRFNLQLWDTAGQERFRSIASSYYRGAHAIILAFDLKRLYSLQAVQHWLEETLQHNSQPLLFLVGTKFDLLSQAEYSIIEKEAINMALTIKAEYWPVSSKMGINVQGFFNRVAALTFCKSVAQELDARPVSRVVSNLVQIGQQKNSRDKKGCKTMCAK